ncbi:hypothetical protein C475_15408 [Halosimplex carlsbadense 2-9-1]|uniref:DUF7344 domain-containing protein n=1 Tax=Halosimplex carlsbadense 2-9-1 TaxID=797114 RepID=M0CKA4_9EURY|nr:hypothetical protein [Halosimplex carlsbadense]ELZ23671.1 hypothetical protein C475_15408 [Halosimplex carlsbadense 2-9-1]
MGSQRSTTVTLSQLSEADVDLVYAALAVADRRFVLALLTDRERPVHLSSVADALAARKHDGPGSAPESLVRSTITALYHVHVPKLADAGIVVYDPESETVSLAADPEVVEKAVELPSID